MSEVRRHSHNKKVYALWTARTLPKPISNRRTSLKILTEPHSTPPNPHTTPSLNTSSLPPSPFSVYPPLTSNVFVRFARGTSILQNLFMSTVNSSNSSEPESSKSNAFHWIPRVGRGREGAAGAGVAQRHRQDFKTTTTNHCENQEIVRRRGAVRGWENCVRRVCGGWWRFTSNSLSLFSTRSFGNWKGPQHQRWQWWKMKMTRGLGLGTAAFLPFGGIF